MSAVNFTSKPLDNHKNGDELIQMQVDVLTTAITNIQSMILSQSNNHQTHMTTDHTVDILSFIFYNCVEPVHTSPVHIRIKSAHSVFLIYTRV